MVANNPAAMALLNGRWVQADLAVVDYSVKFSGAGTDAQGRRWPEEMAATRATPPSCRRCIFHAPATQRLHLGVSIAAPFGFKTEYDDDWVGRYHGIKTELKAIDFGVAASYSVNDVLSLGASVFAERLDVKLRDAVDFGAVLAASRAPGFLPGSADGTLGIDGHSTELGYTLGALLRPVDGTSIGFAYRPQVKHRPSDAKVDFTVPTAANAVLSAARPNSATWCWTSRPTCPTRRCASATGTRRSTRSARSNGPAIAGASAVASPTTRRR